MQCTKWSMCPLGCTGLCSLMISTTTTIIIIKVFSFCLRFSWTLHSGALVPTLWLRRREDVITPQPLSDVNRCATYLNTRSACCKNSAYLQLSSLLLSTDLKVVTTASDAAAGCCSAGYWCQVCILNCSNVSESNNLDVRGFIWSSWALHNFLRCHVFRTIPPLNHHEFGKW